MVKKILLGIVGVVVVSVLVVVGLAMGQPDTFTVERKAVLSASPAAIFPHVEDFHSWEAWSPWEKLDPDMKKTYGGANKGEGATYHWSGNDDVGEGKMTILETTPNEKVSIRLEFIRPFASTSTTVYTLAPKSNGTEVTWSMEGPNSFMGKVMGVFVDMDSMVGKDFEEGLANLDRVSKSGAPTAQN